ncbi:hypothetical protein H2200_006378 [Cladophialophora chaetospira]|uniref:Uncharacterized protein n=1 Tax=Cladophialophora chaetospira TaxID=386627 RepID=A0AA39CH69_9EURO|nr:hypothetical protein H2200_006378 [Cladophialophora chaetospira]
MDYKALAAEHFVSRDLQLSIRTVTRLLQLTNPVRGGDAAQGNLSRYVAFSTAKKDGNILTDKEFTQQFRYFVASHILQLLNKGGSEVSAVLPESFEYPRLVSEKELRKAIRATEILLITRNPQFGELESLGQPDDPFAAPAYRIACGKPHQGGLSLGDDTIEDIITWQKQFEDGNIPIKHIAATAVELLKQNHQAKKGLESSQVYQKLTQFTFVTCLPKIHQHVEHLSRNKNFFHLITMPFEHGKHRLPLPAQLQDFKERFIGLDAMENECTEDLCFVQPSREQKKALKGFARLGLLSEEDAKRTTQQPLFDERGRRNLLQVLSKCLSNVDQACGLAWKSYHKGGRRKKGIKEKFGDVSQETMDSFKKYMNDLVEEMRALWALIRLFPAEMKKLLKWLKTCMDVKHSTLEEKQMFSTGKQPPDDKKLLVTPEQDDTLAQYIAANDTGEDGLDPEWYEVHMLTRHSSWDEAAFKVLETMIMHVDSLQLLKNDPLLDEKHHATKVVFIAEYIRNVELRFVDLLPNQLDNKMHPWDSARLKGLIPNKEACQAFEQFIGAHQKATPGQEAHAKSGVFMGAAHCECIGLMLHALKYKSLFGNQDYSSEDFSKMLASHGVTVTEKTINHFMQAGDVLAVTKRCCPVCYLVVEKVRQLQKTHIEKGRTQRPPALVYTGSHVEWSATSLPPHTPKVIAQEIYKQLCGNLDEAVAQIFYLQQEAYTDAKSFTPGSHTGPSPHATFMAPELGTIDEEPEKSASTMPSGPGDLGSLVHRPNPARDPPIIPTETRGGREAASRSTSPSPDRGRSSKRRASQAAADAPESPARKSRSPSSRRSGRSPANKTAPFPAFFSDED